MEPYVFYEKVTKKKNELNLDQFFTPLCFTESKPASKPAVDLFGGESSSEEEGDLFSTMSSKPDKKTTPPPPGGGEPKPADEKPKKKVMLQSTPLLVILNTELFGSRRS